MLGEKKVIFDKYELGRLLGCGAFAKVYHARNRETGQSVAIKCVSKPKIVKSGLSGNITREISIMRRLRHPNIVRLFEVLASREKIYFVMEFVKGGELFSRLASKGRFPEDQARRYFQQLVSAVGYCHARGVYHRDLKPENLLVDDAGDLKVSDFGLSAVAGGEQVRGDGLLHTMCGTPAYVAPEILAKKGYDGAKVDIWSCGVVLFVLVAGYLPFNDPNLMAMYKKIYKGEYRCPRWMSPDLRRLLSRLLDTDPATRITVDGILHDPWFKKGLDADKWAALAKFHHDSTWRDDDDKYAHDAKAAEDLEDRELNAFDIISFSTGVDLSGMFEVGAKRERFVSRETAKNILAEVEGVARGEQGIEVRKRGEKGAGLALVGRNGTTVARLEVYRLNSDMVLVEVLRGAGDDAKAYDGFWNGKLRPALAAMAWGQTASPVGAAVSGSQTRLETGPAQ